MSCIIFLFLVFSLGFADLAFSIVGCVRADPPGCVFRVPDDDIYFNAPEEGRAARKTPKAGVSNFMPTPPLVRQQIHHCITDWDGLGNALCVFSMAHCQCKNPTCHPSQCAIARPDQRQSTFDLSKPWPKGSIAPKHRWERPSQSRGRFNLASHIWLIWLLVGASHRAGIYDSTLKAVQSFSTAMDVWYTHMPHTHTTCMAVTGSAYLPLPQRAWNTKEEILFSYVFSDLCSIFRRVLKDSPITIFADGMRVDKNRAVCLCKVCLRFLCEHVGPKQWCAQLHGLLRKPLQCLLWFNLATCQVESHAWINAGWNVTADSSYHFPTWGMLCLAPLHLVQARVRGFDHVLACAGHVTAVL